MRAMRQARLKAPEDHAFAYYHVISRVVDRDFVLEYSVCPLFLLSLVPAF